MFLDDPAYLIVIPRLFVHGSDYYSNHIIKLKNTHTFVGPPESLHAVPLQSHA